MSSILGNEWELSKENVIPIKRGRSVKGLQESLTKLPQQEEMELLREQVFLDDLKQNIDSPKEQLETYIKYFKWIRDRFPTNSDRALKLLEKCTCDLKDEESLKNDPRFVKMWIEYADMIKTPGEVFSFMQSNKIGEKVALFWIAWAFVAEKFDNFKLADQIFQKAIRRQAEPKDILQKRYQQFQRRLARHFLNKVEDGSIADEQCAPVRSVLQQVGGTNTDNSHGGFGGLSRQSHSKPKSGAGSNNTRHPSASNVGIDVFVEDAAAEEPIEKMQLTENKGWTQLGRDADRRKENEGKITKWNEAPLMQPNLADPRRLGAGSGTGTGIVPTLAVSSTIPIFVDEELQGQQQRIHASPLTQERGPVNIRHTIDGPSVNPTNDTASRRELKKHIATTDAERIASDPLARHKASIVIADAESTQGQRDRAEITKDITRNNVEPLKASKLKVSESALASRPASMGTKPSQFDIFEEPPLTQPTASITKSNATTATTNKLASKLVAIQKYSSPVSMSTDLPFRPAAGITSKSNTSSAASRSAGIQPFAIFDETVEQPVPNQSVSNKGMKGPCGVSTSAVSRVTSTMQQQQESQQQTTKPRGNKEIMGQAPVASNSFNIFCDADASQPPSRAENTAKLAQPKKVPSNAPVLLSPRATQRPETLYSTPNPVISPSADVHEDDLDHILAEMGVMDDEDGTINTRLAKRDIDSMFCSPGTDLISSSTSTARITGTDKSTSIMKSNPAASDFASNKKPRSKSNDPASSSPKVLTLRSYAGGTFPAYNATTGTASRAFGGSDLSAIQEMSGEYSVFGSLQPSPASGGPWGSKSAFGTRASSISSNDGFSIFCDKMESPAIDTAVGRSSTASHAPCRSGYHQVPGRPINRCFRPQSNKPESPTRAASRRSSSVSILMSLPTCSTPSPTLPPEIENDIEAMQISVDRDLDILAEEFSFIPKRKKHFIFPRHRMGPEVATDSVEVVTSDSVIDDKELINALLNSPPKYGYPLTKKPADTCNIEQTASGKRDIKFPSSFSSTEVEILPSSAQQLRCDLTNTAQTQNSVCIVNVEEYEQQICLQYQQTLANIMNSTRQTDASHRISILINTQELLPPKFQCHGKKTPGTKPCRLAVDHHQQHRKLSTDNMDVIKEIGKGAYGYVLSVMSKLTPITAEATEIAPPRRCPSTSISKTIAAACQTITTNDCQREDAVAKVDLESAYVIWECWIHNLIINRLHVLQARNENTLLPPDIITAIVKYYSRLVVPTSLHVFSNAAVLVMPNCEMGTLHNLILRLKKKQINITTEQHEVLCAQLTLQMLEALLCLHAVDILHGDIKSDNWVLSLLSPGPQPQDQHSCLQLQLIDFGRSKDLQVEQRQQGINCTHDLRQQHRRVFAGNSAAKGLECPEMLHNKPWSYQVDHYGVCSCLHLLLFQEDLVTIIENTDMAQRRGFASTTDALEERSIRIPKCTLKRYWKREMWSEVYIWLLNSELHLEYTSNVQGLHALIIHLTQYLDSKRNIQILSKLFCKN